MYVIIEKKGSCIPLDTLIQSLIKLKKLLDFSNEFKCFNSKFALKMKDEFERLDHISDKDIQRINDEYSSIKFMLNEELIYLGN